MVACWPKGFDNTVEDYLVGPMQVLETPLHPIRFLLTLDWPESLKLSSTS